MATGTNGKVSFARANPKAAQAAQAAAAPAPSPTTAPANPAQADKPVVSGGFVVGAGGTPIAPIEAGVYHGVLVGIYDIGTQPSTYLGQETQKRKGVVVWELVGLRISGTDPQSGESYDRPRTLSSRYTLSMGDKAKLRRDVEAVQGKRMTREEAAKFDLSSLLGMNAQLQITTRPVDGKVYTDIQSVMALMKGQKPVEPETTPAWFHFAAVPEGAVMDASVFPENTPKWVMEKAMQSPEWAALGGQPPAADPMDVIGG